MCLLSNPMVYWCWHCELWENQSNGQAIVMCWLFCECLFVEAFGFIHATATSLVPLWICVAGALFLSLSLSIVSPAFPLSCFHPSELFLFFHSVFDLFHLHSLQYFFHSLFNALDTHLLVYKYNAIDNMRISACAAFMWYIYMCVCIQCICEENVDIKWGSSALKRWNWLQSLLPLSAPPPSSSSSSLPLRYDYGYWCFTIPLVFWFYLKCQTYTTVGNNMTSMICFTMHARIFIYIDTNSSTFC